MERAWEPCGKSVLRLVFAAFRFVEDVSSVEGERKYAQNTTLRLAYKNLRFDASHVGSVRRGCQAPQVLVQIMVGLGAAGYR